MLTYLPPGTAPDIDALRNGARLNRDGHGYAIATGRRLIIGHSMDPDALLEEFEEARAKHPGGPALFHSRMGTHGSIGRYNCHPFRIGGDRRTVLAHNGILPALVRPAKGDQRCDTRIAAEDLLRGEDLGDPVYRVGLANWAGPFNKLVILTVNPTYDQQAWLVNEHAGIWDEGIWYSNRDYRPHRPRDLVWDYNDLAGPEWECGTCGCPDTLDPELGYCTVCQSCADCDQDWLDCQCYLPRHHTHNTDTDDPDAAQPDSAAQDRADIRVREDLWGDTRRVWSR